jgi:CitB family two-component system response regulator MalR
LIRVLLVEDDPMVAELNRICVNRVDGFEATASVRNGVDALEILAKQPVDLILLDIFMPGPTGIDLLSQIRSMALDVDVIFVTAARDTKTISRALKLGAVDYLIKPFEFERLERALKNYRETHLVMHEPRSMSQSELDQSLRRDSTPAPLANELPKGLDRNTLEAVWHAITSQQDDTLDFGCEEIARTVGLSRVSVRKYLEFLCGIKVVRLDLAYGTVGRPTHRYKLQRQHVDEIRRFF